MACVTQTIYTRGLAFSYTNSAKLGSTDIVKVVKKGAEARKLAIENNQEEYYDFETGQAIIIKPESERKEFMIVLGENGSRYVGQRAEGDSETVRSTDKGEESEIQRTK